MRNDAFLRYIHAQWCQILEIRWLAKVTHHHLHFDTINKLLNLIVTSILDINKIHNLRLLQNMKYITEINFAQLLFAILVAILVHPWARFHIKAKVHGRVLLKYFGIGQWFQWRLCTVFPCGWRRNCPSLLPINTIRRLIRSHFWHGAFQGWRLAQTGHKQRAAFEQVIAIFMK